MIRLLVYSIFITSVSLNSFGATDFKEVSQQYGVVVYNNYSDAYTSVVALRESIEAFIKNPTPASHEAAKRAWLDSRYIYGQTEAFRFYNGPIDNENGPEGQINAWPLDEAYIDYVNGSMDSGIVQNPKIAISRKTLIAANEGGSGDLLKIGKGFDPEKSISTGYHAIEFLLWGQDRDPNGPGSRSHLDYVKAKRGPRKFADRRGQYLLLSTQILEDDLKKLKDSWDPKGKNNYHKKFSKDPKMAIRNILIGMGTLSKGELASERIDVALDTRDQEDEHSCFSDNTHVDIYTNVLGIYNVYRGEYKHLKGVGIRDLIGEDDRKQMDAKFTKVFKSIEAMGKPFDRVIVKKNSPEWKSAQQTVKDLFALADGIAGLGKSLELGNIPVNLPE
tara:strand:+ start:109814 stop:110983 length:1170 start_codon:yes stop_codon:yes gene_type:complete